MCSYSFLANRRPGAFINFWEMVLRVELIPSESFINFGEKFPGSCIPSESIKCFFLEFEVYLSELDKKIAEPKTIATGSHIFYDFE